MVSRRQQMNPVVDLLDHIPVLLSTGPVRAGSATPPMVVAGVAISAEATEADHPVRRHSRVDSCDRHVVHLVASDGGDLITPAAPMFVSRSAPIPTGSTLTGRPHLASSSACIAISPLGCQHSGEDRVGRAKEAK